MKIISKFKDFYDYMSQDYDADLIYVRNPCVITDEEVLSLVGRRITKAFEVKYGRRVGLPYHTYRRITSSYYDHSHITTFNVLFGIFPNVYSVALMKVGNKVYVIPDNILETIAKADRRDRDDILIRHVIVGKKILPPDGKKYNVTMDHTDNKSVECREAFFMLGAPVFIRTTSETCCVYGENGVYRQMEGSGKTCIITNICFGKLDANILSPFAEELYTLNTYINIENFLWASKQEPVSEPDNNTKITAHGFDLKTSFRKM